jgi:D-alanyl-D-alanine carboxypeptidase (penicillin-binding protein 5/6)
MSPANLGENKYRILAFMLCALAIEAIMFSIGNFKINEEVRLEEERIEKIGEILNKTPILAKAVSVYNISKSKKIYSKNADVALPIASLAKIMTIAVGLSDSEKGKTILLTPEAIRQSGDFGLYANEKWAIEDLAKLTLISSANDGAYMFGQGTQFLDEVNSKVKRLGAQNTTFYNSTGLDLDLTTAGVFASAEDVNIMTTYLRLAYPVISSVTTLAEINLTSLSGFEHNFKNTNIILDKIPNLLFSKTGFTEVAGGSLVIIFKDSRGDEIAVTILGSTFDGRFSDMEKIVDVLYNYF